MCIINHIFCVFFLIILATIVFIILQKLSTRDENQVITELEAGLLDQVNQNQRISKI